MPSNLYLTNGTLAAYGARNIEGKKLTFKTLVKKRANKLNTAKSFAERSADFLTLPDGANIYKSKGVLNFSPNFMGNVDVFYTYSGNTGNELPSSTSKLDTLSLDISSGFVTLTKNIKINKLLKIDSGILSTGGYAITMGESAPIDGEPSDISGTIQGQAISVATSAYSNTAFGFNLSSGNDIGTFRTLLYKRAVPLGYGEGIEKRWAFTSDNPPEGRDITFSWLPTEDNDNNLSEMQIYNSTDEGSTWYALNIPESISSNPRTTTLSNALTFGDFTISSAIMDATPTSLDFGEVWVGNSTSQQITVANYESQPVSGTITYPSDISISQVTRDKGKNISQKKLGKKIRPKSRSTYNFNISSSEAFNITFSPTVSGNYSDDIIITFNSANNPSKKITFTGTAINPPDINLSQSTISQTQVADVSTYQILTVSNTGDDTLSFSASLSFRNDIRSSINVSPKNLPYWTGSCDASNKSENSLVKAYNTLDGWMKFDTSTIPSEAVIDSVVFHGYVNDTNWPYWSITPLSNDPVTADASTLNADIVAEISSGYYLFSNENNTYSTGWKTYPLAGTIKADVQNTISRGWFAMGIATRDNSTTYYIDFDGWNETNSPYLEIRYHVVDTSWITLNGGTSVNSSVVPSGNSDISVEFNSSDMSDGTYNSTIVINSNDPDEPIVNIPVTLTVATPNISLTPTSLSYGDVVIGSSSTQTFTIENTGGGTLSGNIITPTDFTVTLSSKSIFETKKGNLETESLSLRNSLAYSINAGESKQYNLEFTPQNEASYSQSVQITSNSSSGTTNLSVSGNGVTVDITVNPNSFSKSLTVGATEDDALTISTSGNGTLEYTARIVYPTLQRTVANLLPPSSNYATGSCTDSLFTQTSKIRGFDNQDGWMKFDLSSIPDNASIFSITFHAYVDSTHFPYWSLTPVSHDPQTTDVATLNADIVAEANSGYYLRQNETNSYSIGWKTHTLVGTAVADLQNALTRDWFAMGMVSRDDSSDYYIIFDGWNEANPPYLSIEYAEPDKKWVLLDSVYTVNDSTLENHPDSITVNFDTDGLAEGNYSANISVTSNDPNEPTITIPVSLTVIPNLLTPQNVEISISSPNVILSWDDSGANSYKIYASDTPTGTFTEITSSGSFTRFRSRITWQYSGLSSQKKFYKIVSSNE